MSRKSLIENFEVMIDAELAWRKASESAVLFPPDKPPTPSLDGDEWDKAYLLAQEREATGFYLSGHPLDGMDDYVTKGSTACISQITLSELADGEWVTVGGVITFVETKNTRKGDAMATATIEDRTGSVDCVFFPSAYAKVKAGLSRDLIAFIGGKVDYRDGAPQFIGMSLSVPDMKGKD